MQTKTSKLFIFMGILFALFAILFGLLYYFDVVSGIDLYLAVTYISYFAGIALFYNGAYTREHGRKTSTVLNFLFGAAFVITSTVLLIYGLSTGNIILF